MQRKVILTLVGAISLILVFGLPMGMGIVLGGAVIYAIKSGWLDG